MNALFTKIFAIVAILAGAAIATPAAAQNLDLFAQSGSSQSVDLFSSSQTVTRNSAGVVTASVEQRYAPSSSGVYGNGTAQLFNGRLYAPTQRVESGTDEGTNTYLRARAKSERASSRRQDVALVADVIFGDIIPAMREASAAAPQRQSRQQQTDGWQPVMANRQQPSREETGPCLTDTEEVVRLRNNRTGEMVSEMTQAQCSAALQQIGVSMP